MRGCGCLIVALAGLFLGLYIAGSQLTPTRALRR
jgi:hypothetical protein